MAWRFSLWARWLGWTALYALLTLGIWLSSSLVDFETLHDSGFEELVLWGFVLGPLFLVWLIGVRFGSWWWVLGPPAAILLPSVIGLVVAPIILDWPSDAGYAQALVFAVIYAVVSVIPAAVGVAMGKAWHGGRAKPDALAQPPAATPSAPVLSRVNPATVGPIGQQTRGKMTSTGYDRRSGGGTAVTVGRALGRWTRGGRWRLPAFFASLSGIALAVMVGAFALHLEVILVFVAVVVVFVCIVGLALNPRAAIAVGRMLALWTRSGPWRRPVLFALLGTVGLAVAVIAIRLHAPAIFYLYVVLPIFMYFAGRTMPATRNRHCGDARCASPRVLQTRPGRVAQPETRRMIP